MDLDLADPPGPRQSGAFLALPVEIRLLIYSRLLDGPLRLRLHRPHSNSAPLRESSVSFLLQTCRQIHDEASPVFYRNVYFGWLGNMTKALSCPTRKAFYSKSIVEVTSRYNRGLIKDCLSGAMCLGRLQRLVLVGEVFTLHYPDNHISAIQKCLHLYRNDLSGIKSVMPFEVRLRVSVVKYAGRTRICPIPIDRDRAEQLIGTVCDILHLAINLLTFHRATFIPSTHATTYVAKPMPNY